VIAHSDDLLDLRFSSQTFTAALRALSEIIEEEGIESIDLLKINVEKSELDVLTGIKEADWAKIKQIVVEADTKANLRAISLLLEEHGYELAIEQDVLLKNTELCYVYAVRPSSTRRRVRERGESAPVQSLPDPVDMSLSTPSLRSFLQKRLPDYMVPSAFVVLEELPLTPNGKIDRRALPVPVLDRESADFVAPRTETEKTVAEAWSGVLHVERIGVHDDFFQLGGHSLLAMRVVSQLRSAFGLDIPLRVFFENGTVAVIAAYIDGAQLRAMEPAAAALLEREEVII
jgi:acyl carrier protein